MKLEVGMYIRTKYCGICDEIAIRKIIKIDKINNNWFYIDKNVCDIYKDYTNKLNTVNVEKASFNIIDILEVGDYVNGSKVVNINYDLNYVEDIVESITIFDYSIEENDILHNEDIKSIVTKEMFSSMEYRLGDDE